MQTPGYSHAGNMGRKLFLHGKIHNVDSVHFQSQFLLTACLSLEAFSEVGEVERLRHENSPLTHLCRI